MFITQARLVSQLRNKMHKKIRSAQKGLTLLELVFALTVIAVLVMLSVGQYKRHLVSKDLELVRYNVDLIFQAANQCFWINRTKGDPTIKNNCTKTGLQLFHIWPSLFVKSNSLTPSDDNYDFSISNIATGNEKNHYLVTVSVIFPNTGNNQSLLNWYLGKLNALCVNASCISPDPTKPANTLFWTRIPTYSTPSANTELWINNTQLQQFRSIVQDKPSPPPSP